MKAPIAKAGIATPKTDAALRERYNRMGAQAFREGQPRTPPCDPTSMIGGWWYEGYDRQASLQSEPDTE